MSSQMYKKYLKKWHRAAKAVLQKKLLAIGKILFDRAPNVEPFNIPLEIPQSVLFLRQDGKIGDSIVSSFAFREMKRINPKIKIGVVCTQSNVDLFKYNQYVDEIHLVKGKSISDYYRVGKSIHKQYEVVLNPTVFIRNRDLVLLRAIAARYNIGYLNAQYKIFNINIEQSDLHFSKVYQEMLRICGFTHIDGHYYIPENPQANKKIDLFLQENNLTNYIAINFFGAARYRQFSRDSIRKYLQYFQDKLPNKKVVVLTYPKVTNMLEEIISEFKNVYMYAPTDSIFYSIQLIKKADWVISCDTAIVHIASGFDKKIIAFYGDDQQNFMNWHPTTSETCKVLFYKNDINEIEPEQLPAIN